MIDADFPTTLPEFQSRFSDEDACLEYLRRKKWPSGIRCPRCCHGTAHTLRARRIEQCARCRHQTSITAGTMFHKTRKPLRLWFLAIFEFVSRKHGCNAMDLQRLLGLSRLTAWTWLHKIRDVMVTEGRALLDGTVEVDETYIGGPEAGVSGRALGEKKHLIAGAVEIRGKGCGRVRLSPVASANAEDLQTWLSDEVKEGARVHSDGWGGYKGLEHVYGHDVEIVGDPKTASVKFPHVHRVFSLFQRVLLSTYQGSVSAKYLWAYCQEFAFRFNRRTSRRRTLLVQRVLENAVLKPPRIHLFAGKRGVHVLAKAG
jgi:transposase-like protein